jgi:hypothetical protein
VTCEFTYPLVMSLGVRQCAAELRRCKLAGRAQTSSKERNLPYEAQLMIGERRAPGCVSNTQDQLRFKDSRWID